MLILYNIVQLESIYLYFENFILCILKQRIIYNDG